MPYNNVISRADAAAAIPEEVARDIWGVAAKESVALQVFRRINVSAAQVRIPVVSALPVAYWVSPTDTGIKQTTEVNWTNVYLNIEELACIVPIPQSVFDDIKFDVWDAIRPHLVTAIGRALDAAVFFGTNKPSTFPSDIVTAATAAGNTVVSGTATAAGGGLAGDMTAMFGTVWADGYPVTFAIAPPQSQTTILNTRDTQGRQLDDFNYANGVAMINGVPIMFVLGGLWPTAVSTARAIAGDGTQGIIGVRQDITFKVLDQAVITDNAGVIVFNLAQQDMIALRVVFRVGFAVPNPLTYEQPVGASRYPFGVLLAAAT
jgi:HK97 family phage major capsid protein